MPKRFHPQALTANDLMSGDAVWWTGADWSRDPAAAEIAASPEATEAFAAMAADRALQAVVVGPYLVELDAAGRPLSRRERIRAAGAPTFAYAPDAPRKAA